MKCSYLYLPASLIPQAPWLLQCVQVKKLRGAWRQSKLPIPHQFSWHFNKWKYNSFSYLWQRCSLAWSAWVGRLGWRPSSSCGKRWDRGRTMVARGTPPSPPSGSVGSWSLSKDDHTYMYIQWESIHRYMHNNDCMRWTKNTAMIVLSVPTIYTENFGRSLLWIKLWLIHKISRYTSPY